MKNLVKKILFFIELLFSGSFIFSYSIQNIESFKWVLNKVDLTLMFEFWNNYILIIPIFLVLSTIYKAFLDGDIEHFFRYKVLSIIISVALIITWGDPLFTYWLASINLFSGLFIFYNSKKSNKLTFLSRNVKTFYLRPSQIVILSFTSVIVLGTALLLMPISSVPGKSLSFIDALFMATSATCVTGLATKSLVTDLSFFGQIVILILIQIGGLSIMTLYSSLVILLGKSMGMKDRVLMQDLLDVSSLDELFEMILDIVKYTFFIELWGAIILTIAFIREDFDLATSIYYGFFHSISAFCNAGFSLFDSSLESFATNPLINFTVSGLIILGGLGFIVLKDLRLIFLKEKTWVRLAIHSKIVIITSFLLIAIGFLLIFFTEYLHAFDDYNLWEKIQIAFFQSVTLRTAGFNSIPLTDLHAHTLYVMTLFMFIGGSPGSTAGGVKTTTLAILVQSITATLKGEKDVYFFDRSIPSPTIVRAIALIFISIMITSSFIFVLMRFEAKQDFLSIFFEVMSASGTVGLSLGVTPILSSVGKFLVALLMFSGRIGPLTLMLGFGQKDNSHGKRDYPTGRIMIG